MALRYRYSMWDGTQEVPPLDADDILDNLTDDLMNFGDLQHALRNLLQRGMRNPMGDRMQGLRDLLQQLRQQRRQTARPVQPLLRLRRHQAAARRNPRHGAQHPRPPPGRGRPASGRTGPARRTGQQSPQGPGGSSPVEQGSAAAGQQGRRAAGNQPGQRAVSRAEQQGGAERPASSPTCSGTSPSKKKQFLENLPEDVAGQVKELQNYEFMDPEAPGQVPTNCWRC